MGNTSSAVDAFDAFWSALSNGPLRMEDVDTIFSLSFPKKKLMYALSNEFVREIRHFHTERFALLLYCCIKEISVMREKKKASVSSFMAEETHRFLTALQILRRLLPIAFEDGATEIDTNEERQTTTTTSAPSPEEIVSQAVLPQSGSDEPNTFAQDQGHASPQPPGPVSPDAASFSQKQNRVKTKSTHKFQQLFFMEGNKCNDREVDSHFPLLPLQETSEAPLVLGPYLAWVLVESCFIRGLTLLEEKIDTNLPHFNLHHPEVDMSLLWHPGTVCADPSEAPVTSAPSEVHTSRRELLETLLVLVSSPLFNPSSYRDIIFTESLISVSVVPLMPTLAVSLLNSILTYKPHSYFPYATNLSIDEREVVITGSRLLSAILYYPGIPIRVFSNALRDEPSMKRDQGSNFSPLARAKDSEGDGRGHPAMTNSQEHAQEVDKIQGDTLTVPLVDKQESSPEIRSSGRLVLHSPSSSTSSLNSGLMPYHQSSGRALNIARNGPFPGNSQSRQSYGDAVGGVSESPAQLCFVHSIRKVVHDLTMSEAKLILDRLKNTMVPGFSIGQSVLPSSWFDTISQDGLMFLLSKLLDISPSVSNQFSFNPGVLPYLVQIVEYGMDAQKSTYFARQAEISLNILLHLSQNRGFTLQCNQFLSASISFPFPSMPSGSTFNDFLVTALSFFIGFRDASLGSQIISCSAVLSNMAPFITNLGKVGSRSLVAVFAYLAHQCLEHAATNTLEKLAIYGPAMAATCEAISCLLRYHEEGSRYVIVCLLNYRNLIGRVREAYTSSNSLRASINGFFMIQDLEAVVAAALPIVDSLGILSKFSDNSQDEQNDSEFNAFWVRLGKTFEYDKVVMRKLSTLVLVGMLLPHKIIIKGVQVTKQMEEQMLGLFWGSMFISFGPGTLGDYKSIKLLRFR